MEMSRVMSLAMSLGLSRGTESDADNEDELASEFDLDADSGASRSRRDYNAVAVAMLRKMTLHNGFLERPCKFRNLFCGVTIAGDGGSVTAAISIMEGHISFFWKLVDAGVSLGSLVSMYSSVTRDTMTLGALALLSLVRQCPGANRGEDRDIGQIAGTWAAHDNVTVLRCIHSLLECGVELSELSLIHI